MRISSINRFFNILLGALAMLIVALLSAFITMRLAIHGREVKIPNLTGLSLAEASDQTRSLGLRLNLENRFYSPNTPPGRVLAQSPAPGVTVRREWAVRVTESLGPQQVAIPAIPPGNYVDLVSGQAASLSPGLTTFETAPFSVALFVQAESPCAKLVTP